MGMETPARGRPAVSRLRHAPLLVVSLFVPWVASRGAAEWDDLHTDRDAFTPATV